MREYDVVVIGGGLVGLATARSLLAGSPGMGVCVLEKDGVVASQQSGHNSSVIHSGVYYKPGSLKARLCMDGSRRLFEFCEAKRIEVRRCGKVIVAVDHSEILRLEELYRRGVANGLEGLSLVDETGLKEIEPYAAGVAALHVPTAAIVDYRLVAAAMVDEIRDRGGDVLTYCGVKGFGRSAGNTVLATTQGTVVTRHFINCAGLQSDLIALMAGETPPVHIVPFRGEYYVVRPERRQLVKGLLYPTPDPDLPFLGVHFTRRVDGQVEAGPNAVLAFAREGYRVSDVDLSSLALLARYPGIWRMIPGYWRTGVSEYRRSLSKSRFVKSLQRLLPAITRDDVVRGGAGVRAQALDRQGHLLDDFCFGTSEEAIHVYNAPSPAATACLAIGDHISDLAARSFGLTAKPDHLA
jgi:L-2-hydroxyglutarate oxidase LhgO